MDEIILSKFRDYIKQYEKFKKNLEIDRPNYIYNSNLKDYPKQDSKNQNLNFFSCEIESRYFEIRYFGPDYESLPKYTKQDNKFKTFVIIPSIFNSTDILNFSPQNSFTNILSKIGQCYLLKWKNQTGNISLEQVEHDITDIISQIDGQIEMIGHCLGGSIALRYTSRFDNGKISSLTLLTASDNYQHFTPSLKATSNLRDCYKGRVIKGLYWQIMFFLYMPDQFYKKIDQFSTGPTRSQREQILALEYWLQSGIDVSHYLFEDLAEEFIYNKNEYSQNIFIPVYLASCQKDKLVPAKLVAELATKFKNCRHKRLEGGHIHYLTNDIMPLAEDYINWQFAISTINDCKK